MIVYDRLWETMKTKKITQYRLIHYCGFSAGQIGRLKKNAYVSTHTVEVLCKLLNCNVEEIMEFRPDNQASALENEAPKQSENQDTKGLS